MKTASSIECMKFECVFFNLRCIISCSIYSLCCVPPYSRIHVMSCICIISLPFQIVFNNAANIGTIPVEVFTEPHVRDCNAKQKNSDFGKLGFVCAVLCVCCVLV